ncbi:hypothetical protein BCY89_00055 [Sphingobacterium siyangense]|uniref:Lipid A biosynthesis acyltransferase n=1 Tax=Sphingobacterium siyangense TaxID=459529 RepID=A0A420G9W6_9SPHI|nr:hypothetical protein [Sphingobacterium siyangense]RKF41946.1 hypothetical protein BCY89_00055 [Sphingobacterium siyangense]
MAYEHRQDWNFALFSANLHQYLPDMHWGVHDLVYEVWKTVHQPKKIQPDETWDTACLSDLKQASPRIICLYHLGMHAQLPKVLADAGISFDLLLDRRVFENQKAQLLAVQSDLQSQGSGYRFLMSDDPQVLLKARQSIRQGRHLLVFADGNSGTGESLDKKVCIKFMDGNFYARAGIAWLSYILHIPVLPISHSEMKPGYRLLLGTEIAPFLNEHRSEYAQRCLFELYDFLAAQIRKSPWQWACWGYLHQLNCYLVPPMPSKDEQPPADESLIDISLMGKKGVFSRKYFYCVFG